MNKEFLDAVIDSIRFIDLSELDKMIDILVRVKECNGRLFIIGSGGGAGHASHAAADFRKICEIEAYAPYDNVSELTARTNDEGYETTIVEYLRISKIKTDDCVLILSVGGGTNEVSKNISNVFNHIPVLTDVIAITGPNGGLTSEYADACVKIQAKNPEFVTPVTEGMQAVIWHLLVTNPKLKINKTKW